MNLENFSVKSVYFYLISLISLLAILFNTQTVLVTGLRYFVFETAPTYTYQPPFLSPFIGSPQVVRLGPPEFSGKGSGDLEARNEDSLRALKENQELTDAQKRSIDDWLDSFERWKSNQEDQKRRIVDNLIGNFVALLIFTPVFSYHFKKAREG